MGIAGSLIMIAVTWWLMFLMVLPIGVRSQQETGEIVPGSDPGAPVNPHLRVKAVIATGLALAAWAVLFALIEWDVVRIPGVAAQ